MPVSANCDSSNEGFGASVGDDDPDSPFFAPKSPEGMSLCYGCRPLHRCRLGIEAERMDEDSVVISRLSCSAKEEGGPRVAHGGWTAGVMDELVGHALTMRGEFVVTGTLTVKFVRPVPIEWPLLGRSWISGREGRKVFVEATIELESSGAILAEARATMIKRPDSHFESHYRWLAEQQGPVV